MYRRIRLALVTAAISAFALTAPVNAITWGQADNPSNPQFPYVGALLATYDFGEGDETFGICTGTLIAEGVFLTAAHCLLAFPLGTLYWISFDVEPDVNHLIAVDSFDLHPQAWAHPRSNQVYDVALVMFDDETGIEPAQLPSANALGLMSKRDLNALRFTAVGYGATRDTMKGAFQAIGSSDPLLRRYASQSVFSLTPGWLTLSMVGVTGNGGTCYGDSGGPHLVGDTVYSVTVTGDRWCKATDKTQRIDIPAVLNWITDSLESG